MKQAGVTHGKIWNIKFYLIVELSPDMIFLTCGTTFRTCIHRSDKIWYSCVMKNKTWMMQSYQIDLSETQWAEIKPLFSGLSEYNVLYFVKTGCHWRHLPHDFPPYSTVHSFYRRARLSGLWDAFAPFGEKGSRWCRAQAAPRLRHNWFTERKNSWRERETRYLRRKKQRAGSDI